MPYRSSAITTPAKRQRYKRKQTSRVARKKRVPRNLVTVSAGVGFPRKLKMTHKYSMNVTMNSAATPTHHLFSANGLYDPDLTGVGHQPSYFDTMATIYRHYTVLTSRIKVTLTHVASDTYNLPVRWAVWKNDNGSAGAIGIDTIWETSQVSSRVLAHAATSAQVARMNWSAKKTFGGDILDNDELQGSLATNPAEQTTYVVTIQSLSGNDSTVYATIEIEYDAIWDELQNLVAS